MSNKEKFGAFDMSEIEAHQKKYASEVKDKYGHTNSYKESRMKTSKYTKEDWARIREESDHIMKSLASHMAKDPGLCLANFYMTPLPMNVIESGGFFIISILVLISHESLFPYNFLKNNPTGSLLFRYILPFSIPALTLGSISFLTSSEIPQLNPAIISGILIIFVAFISGLISILISLHIKIEIDKSRISEERAIVALKESEKVYRALTEDSPLMVCRFNLKNEIIYANTSYCKYHDQGVQDVLGQNFSELIPEDERELVKKSISSLSKNHQTISNNHRVQLKDGTIRWHRWTNRAIFDDDGYIAEYQSIGEDITEMVRIQQKLKDRNDELSKLNKEYESNNIELGKSNAKLKSALENLEKNN